MLGFSFAPPPCHALRHEPLLRVGAAKVAVAATVTRESPDVAGAATAERRRAGAEGANPPRNLSGHRTVLTGTLKAPAATRRGDDRGGGLDASDAEGAFR